jgi:mono/diheme cytochrome c family protein
LRNLLAGCAALLCAAVAAAAQQPQPGRKTVLKDAAFTAAQAERGRQAYQANCVGCHLPGLDGSANPAAKAIGAPLVGARFVQDFGEAKVGALFNKIMRDMPSGKAGTLSEAQYLDLTAFLLQENKFPAGAAELTVDLANDVWIPGPGGAEGLADYTYVSGAGCLQQDPTRSWILTGAQALKEADLPKPGDAPVPIAEAPGDYNFRLLNAYNYSPESGRKVRVSGYLVRLGAEIRVNVQALQMAGLCAP